MLLKHSSSFLNHNLITWSSHDLLARYFQQFCQLSVTGLYYSGLLAIAVYIRGNRLRYRNLGGVLSSYVMYWMGAKQSLPRIYASDPSFPSLLLHFMNPIQSEPAEYLFLHQSTYQSSTLTLNITLPRKRFIMRYFHFL